MKKAIIPLTTSYRLITYGSIYIFLDSVKFLNVCGGPGFASALVHTHKKQNPAGNDGLISVSFALIFNFQCGPTKCEFPVWPYYAACVALLHVHRFRELISSQCEDDSNVIAATIDTNVLKK